MDGNEVLLLNNNKKSEQLKLLPRGVWLNRLLAVKQLDGAKLLVGYAKHTDMAILRKKRFYALYMYLSLFVSVGRSKKTSIHIILYSLKRSVIIYNKVILRTFVGAARTPPNRYITG